ncbi:MAG: 6-phosphogluconolactonase [Mariprofundales bacterium]
MQRNIIILHDQMILAAAVAHAINEIGQASITQRGVFRFALAGGNTPRLCYEYLHDQLFGLNWQKCEIYFGDERCLAVGHNERNDTMARDSLLQHVNIPETQVHNINAEKGASIAAQEYTVLLNNTPQLDLVLLGMGEDGHTASLFPNNPALALETAAVPVFNAPKAPSERVSMSMDYINTARYRIVMVAGDKQAALEALEAGEDIPIAKLKQAAWWVLKNNDNY